MIQLNKHNIAPPNAKHINVYDENNNKVGFMPLGTLRKPNGLGKKLYSFGICSDLHIGQDATTISKFKQFLNYCESNKDIKFILNCGDSAYHSTTVPNPNLTALNALETEYNNLSEQNYEIFLKYCKTMRERTYKNSKGETISRLTEWDNKKNKSSKNWKNFNKIKNELFSNPFISIAGNHEHWMYEFQEFLIEYYDFENGNYYKFSRPVREPKSEYPIIYSTLNNSNISNIDEFMFDIKQEKYYKKIDNQLKECEINYANIWELNEINNFSNIKNPVERQAIWDSEKQEVYYHYNNQWNLIKLHNNQAIYLKQSKRFLNQLNNNWIDFTEEMEDELHYLKRYTSERGEPFYYLIVNDKETIQLLSSIEFNNLNESEQLEILKNVSDIILGNSVPAYTSKSGIDYQGYSWKRDTLTILHKYYERFRNKRMFVLQHFQPEFLNKENGFLDLPLYEEGENKGLINPISQEISYKYIPLSLQQHYKNTITFHGHKHWGLNSIATNHFDEKNEKFGFNVVNIPPLEEKCEGYLVDVYKNYIHIYGVKFKENNELEFNAKRSYLIDTTIEEIEPMSYQPEI